ncbi:MAG: YggS family pyridoxal phosphate-dependent enzyme [Clostridiales bacterium]|nr:YggS family pyridoxal phosphate-dependent enzyme [Clostridiales bacterium]
MLLTKNKMLENNLKQIFADISSGNNLGEPITLVGATKMVDIDTINRAIELGLKVVAENKVQEFNLKNSSIVGAKQHFIGHLQTNKVKYLVGKVDLIQSVDSDKLASEIDRVAKNRNLVQNILIEVNIGGELSKSGFTLEKAFDSVVDISNKYSNICVKGLMAMLPHTDDESLLENLCQKMRGLYDKLKENGMSIEYLSMGMSNDYLVAIKNGSNMIRLGSSIFGKRNYLK